MFTATYNVHARYRSQRFRRQMRAAPHHYWLIVAATHFHLHPDTLCGPSRTPVLARARWVVMHLMAHDGFTLTAIGKRLGGRHYSTVIHGLAQVERDPALQATAVTIRAAWQSEQERARRRFQEGAA